MSLLNDRDLATLLMELKDVERTDKEGAYDYAFLEETIFPTLLPALVQLSEHVEKRDLPPMPTAEGLAPDGATAAFNPLRSLGELLMRQHPQGVFKEETVYSKHLEAVAASRKEQRLQRELLISEQERKEKQEAMLRELERTQQEEQEAREWEQQRSQALQQKLEVRAAESLKDAELKAGTNSNLMGMREACMNIIGSFDFSTASDTSAVSALIYQQTCKVLVTDSTATFVGAGSLDKPGAAATMLHYHTAGDKKEFEVEEDEEPAADLEEGAEVEEKPPKEAPPPEITTRTLPPLEDELALVLKRGHGITWSTVIDGEEKEDEEGEVTRDKPVPKYVADAKFTEGMFFFEEKRAGTYLAVPIWKDDEVIGVLCADTLDSVIGSELQPTEIPLFESAAYIMQQCLDYAEWCLLDARRQKCTRRLESLAKDPRTLPGEFAVAFVESLDMLVPGMHVATGVFDTDTNMRLVCNKAHDGNTTEDVQVSAEEASEHVTGIYAAKGQRDTWLKKTESGEHVVAIAAPIIDSNNFVPAVLYAASDPKSKPPHQDILDFVQDAARLATPILLAPAPSAMRILSVLAAAGTGNPKTLYETAALLCHRYTRAGEAFIACSHGTGFLRVLHQVGTTLESKIARADFAAADEAIRTQSSAAGTGYVAAPLLRKGGTRRLTAFGVLMIQSGELQVEQHKAFEGVAAALSAALEVSEFRRKMSVCSLSALDSLLKRSPAIKGAYFAFCDIGGQQVCATVRGESVESVNEGSSVFNSAKIQTQAVQPDGTGPIVGFIGVAAQDVNESGISMYGDSAWSVMQDVAATLAHVSVAVTAEGLMVDTSLAEYATNEERLQSCFSIVRFDLVTKMTVQGVSLKFIDLTKTSKRPSVMTQKILSAIMYIMGHQQRDVSEWPKCRKLITHHLFKEMRMIDVRAQLKVCLVFGCAANSSVSGGTGLPNPLGLRVAVVLKHEWMSLYALTVVAVAPECLGLTILDTFHRCTS